MATNHLVIFFLFFAKCGSHGRYLVVLANNNDNHNARNSGWEGRSPIQ